MKNLIKHLTEQGYLKTPEIISAFYKINRTDFLNNRELNEEKREQQSEINAPLPIACGQTISQPLTVALMLEMLQPQVGDKVLDVGSGSGWTACLLAEIVGPGGKVVAVERIPELKEFGEQNAKKYKHRNLKFHCGDGAKRFAEQAPYNRIHVAAAAKNVPSILIKQLANGGKMVIPVGIGTQEMILLSKSKSGSISKERTPGFAFVPLIEEQ
ncbi:protein-L-isoaspartate(D-aspartate) O-methyltransferase [Patescibacteria group bacterium]|nr:protein-L-isoaspartate(D-aspartate) O-methyltransferase [Patescibacteria group bacterium]MBU1890822.1 protein-L-isoaspartate(D-aspartate) O-methyltransferase [Patescibacteria group bacterium]